MVRLSALFQAYPSKAEYWKSPKQPKRKDLKIMMG